MFLWAALNNPAKPSVWDKPPEEFDLRLSMVNIRSLQANFQELSNDFVMQKCDVICLCETWLSEDLKDIRTFNINGYDFYHCSSGKGKGVAAYVSEKFNIQRSSTTRKEGLQCLAVMGQHLDILVVYRSQNGSLEELFRILEDNITAQRPTVLWGDFNLGEDKFKCTTLLNFMECYGFQQLVKKPTHIQGHILDLAFVNFELKDDIQHHYPYYTDHDALCLKLDYMQI